MNGAYAFAALREGPHAVLLSDADGKISLCNSAAARMLQTEPTLAEGQSCWKVGRFETVDGEPFCAPDCPIQRQGRAGHLEPLHRVVVRTRASPPIHVELLTFLMAPAHRNRRCALHLLLPTQAPSSVPGEKDPSTRPETPVLFLSRLSAREVEVMGLLARGFETATIAATLRISPVTVRTHVQRILKKLGVHRRLDAVLALIGRGR